jgi:hypothetical protein
LVVSEITIDGCGFALGIAKISSGTGFRPVWFAGSLQKSKANRLKRVSLERFREAHFLEQGMVARVGSVAAEVHQVSKERVRLSGS